LNSSRNTVLSVMHISNKASFHQERLGAAGGPDVLDGTS
jgi:hypothetical protein